MTASLATAAAAVPATDLLAGFVAELDPAAIGETTRRAAALALVDMLGCALGGASTNAGRTTANLAVAQGGPAEATILATGHRAGLLWTAFANAASAHALELDDLHSPSITHGGAIVIPAALALGERLGASGRAVLEAIVVGYDVMYRIGESVAPAHYRRFHSTGTCGTFGAAAAAARLLGLDRERARWALSHAAAQAQGVRRTSDDSKTLNAGKAAMNGLIAASLAETGFRGVDDMIEGHNGFFVTTSDGARDEVLTAGLGETFKIEENGYKLHACCRHAHVAIDLVGDLLARTGFAADDVAALRVTVNPISAGILDRGDPASAYKAMFDLRFIMATALRHGTIDPGAFSAERFADPELRTLMQRVEILPDPSLQHDFPLRWTTRVEIEPRQGGRIEAQADYPRGDPRNPVAESVLFKKYHGLADPVLGRAVADRLLEAALRLDDLAQVREVTAMLASEGDGTRARRPAP